MTARSILVHTDGSIDEIGGGFTYLDGFVKARISADSLAAVRDGDILRIEFDAHTHPTTVDGQPAKRVCMENHGEVPL